MAGEAGRLAASKSGWKKSAPVWHRLIVKACIDRDITPTGNIINQVLTDAFGGNMHLGYSTVDSYIGLLQATGKLVGVTTKIVTGDIEHYERLELKSSPAPKGFDASWVWGKNRPSSSEGLSTVMKSFRGKG